MLIPIDSIGGSSTACPELDSGMKGLNRDALK